MSGSNDPKKDMDDKVEVFKDTSDHEVGSDSVGDTKDNTDPNGTSIEEVNNSSPVENSEENVAHNAKTFVSVTSETVQFVADGASENGNNMADTVDENITADCIDDFEFVVFEPRIASKNESSTVIDSSETAAILANMDTNYFSAETSGFGEDSSHVLIDFSEPEIDFTNGSNGFENAKPTSGDGEILTPVLNVSEPEISMPSTIYEISAHGANEFENAEPDSSVNLKLGSIAYGFAGIDNGSRNVRPQTYDYGECVVSTTNESSEDARTEPRDYPQHLMTENINGCVHEWSVVSSSSLAIPSKSHEYAGAKTRGPEGVKIETSEDIKTESRDPSEHFDSEKVDCINESHVICDFSVNASLPRILDCVTIETGGPEPNHEWATTETGDPEPSLECATTETGDPEPSLECATTETGDPEPSLECATTETGDPEPSLECATTETGDPEPSLERATTETGCPATRSQLKQEVSESEISTTCDTNGTENQFMSNSVLVKVQDYFSKMDISEDIHPETGHALLDGNSNTDDVPQYQPVSDEFLQKAKDFANEKAELKERLKSDIKTKMQSLELLASKETKKDVAKVCCKKSIFSSEKDTSFPITLCQLLASNVYLFDLGGDELKIQHRIEMIELYQRLPKNRANLKKINVYRVDIEESLESLQSQSAMFEEKVAEFMDRVSNIERDYQQSLDTL